MPARDYRVGMAVVVAGTLNAAVMRRFERVVALPDPKNVDFTQPNQQLGSSLDSSQKRLRTDEFEAFRFSDGLS